MTKIALLGTGLLGSAFAEAAAKRGDDVTVWNRSVDKARALTGMGVRVAETPADAVRGAARVHLVLRDDAVVSEVIDALRPGLRADAVICDHTTTQPALTAARAERLAALGVRYLHCPVFMGPAAARKGEGVMMVAGLKVLFDVVAADLAKMTGALHHLGERPDLAASYKLFGNALIIGISAAMADVFTMAKGAGLSATDAVKLLDVFNPAGLIAARAQNMASGNFAASFELDMARKDVRLMLETAGAGPLAILPAIAERMDALIAAGHARDDLGVLAKDAVARSA